MSSAPVTTSILVTHPDFTCVANIMYRGRCNSDREDQAYLVMKYHILKLAQQHKHL